MVASEQEKLQGFLPPTGCKLPQELDFPFDVNGFEYQIREVNRCAATGRHHSSIYTPQQSIALTQLMYDIRMAWGMKFEGEE